MQANRFTSSPFARGTPRRHGMILILAAAATILILGFAAFSVDVGYIALTRAQLQVGADAAAMASVRDLLPGLTKGAYETPGEVAANGRATAMDMASRHRAGDRRSIYCDGARDVRFGQVVWDPVSDSWQKLWDVAPYNAVEVTLRRDQFSGGGTPSASGDGPLPLFFAPVIGNQTAKLSVNAVSAVLPARGFQRIPGQGIAGILPITLDETTWDYLVDGTLDPGVCEQDLFTYNEDTGTVTPGADGIPECNLYPNGAASAAPGNRGTVDIGAAGNSTNDIKRQILHGVSDSDLEILGFPLNFDSGPFELNGDTGISAAIKAELEQIKGQPRVIPIFTQLVGNGNNAYYTITKFVGIRIVEVKLTGNPKRVMIQPAPYVDPMAEIDRTGTSVEDATFFTTATLIE